MVQHNFTVIIPCYYGIRKVSYSPAMSMGIPMGISMVMCMGWIWGL